jgi:hypothetical protein
MVSDFQTILLRKKHAAAVWHKSRTSTQYEHTQLKGKTHYQSKIAQRDVP